MHCTSFLGKNFNPNVFSRQGCTLDAKKSGKFQNTCLKFKIVAGGLKILRIEKKSKDKSCRY